MHHLRTRLQRPIHAVLGLLVVVLATAWQAQAADQTASPAIPLHDPRRAIADLDVLPGLALTLFASEPVITSVTNLDVDDRGRVWVCEVMNYRKHQGTRPAGDRILILEDRDGDGKADDVTVFYQGHDVDAAMGICVLGNRVIVTCSPNVLVLTDSDGDDRADRKEYLFTRTGPAQDDHGAHSFLFGPDGRLYWNFGNATQQVRDASGRRVTDWLGRPVADGGHPFRGGMAVRCRMDGSRLEVLGHNFRNCYEVTVDSFGTVWQSDNDDDGNRGVRINYVMEGGNFGYRDERTGAGWREPRTGMHPDVPHRHWHVNDPGVVPNLLLTGGGSPAGITVYEGRLLPAACWDQLIHCDAGPRVVRAYPASPAGAGFHARSIDLVRGTRDDWFRPVDVAVAPDGSLLITDWYDPGVGGHNQGDLKRGRIFRLAPAGSRYRVPRFDFETATGAVAALRNPAFSVRYLAWKSLQAMGAGARAALEPLLSSDNARFRARALWLLARIEGEQQEAVDRALADPQPRVRVMGLRLARQLEADPLPRVRQMAHDRSPQVRRQAALVLQGHRSVAKAKLWAELASQHDGRDRWYVEALGIAADGDWDACLAAWLARVGDGWDSPAGRDILWRSRSRATPAYLARLVLAGKDRTTVARYLRAFDFLAGDTRERALKKIACAHDDDRPLGAWIASEAMVRLTPSEAEGDPRWQAAFQRVLAGNRGTRRFVELIARYHKTDHATELLALAEDHADAQLGSDAMRVLLEQDGEPVVASALRDTGGVNRSPNHAGSSPQPGTAPAGRSSGTEPETSAAIARVLGHVGNRRAVALLEAVIDDGSIDLGVRRQAARSLTRSREGGRALIERIRAKRLDQSLADAAAVGLATAPIAALRRDAAALFPPPADREHRRLPTLPQLLARHGDAAAGRRIFFTTGTCATCHRVGDQGKEVGPPLTEIGTKLGRQALFESILYPNAGINHNYATYAVLLEDGRMLSGLLVSQTPDLVTIKVADAIVHRLPRAEIDSIEKQQVSLMPGDLQKVLSAGELVDLVAYLATLRARHETIR